MLSRSSSEPLHAQLTRSLRNLILHNFDDGESFYPEETLGERLGLSVGTVRRSLTRLMDEGILDRHRGRGSFVRRNTSSRGKGFRVAVVLNTYDSFFNRTLLREISFLCQLRGYLLDVSNPGQDRRVSTILGPVAIQEKGLGFLLLSLDQDFTYDLCRGAEERGIPFVSVDTPIPGYAGAEVKVANRKGIELGVTHLAQLGHRRIVLLLSEDPFHANIVERVEAFNECTAALGIDGFIVESAPDPTFEDRSHAMVMSTEERYDNRINAHVTQQVRDTGATAVFCVSDIGACLLMKRLHLAGVRIPEEMSIMGFNDEGICRLVHPELTTIAQPYAEMAAQIMNLLETYEACPQHFRLEPRLIIRESTGPRLVQT